MGHSKEFDLDNKELHKNLGGDKNLGGEKQELIKRYHVSNLLATDEDAAAWYLNDLERLLADPVGDDTFGLEKPWTFLESFIEKYGDDIVDGVNKQAIYDLSKDFDYKQAQHILDTGIDRHGIFILEPFVEKYGEGAIVGLDKNALDAGKEVLKKSEEAAEIDEAEGDFTRLSLSMEPFKYKDQLDKIDSLVKIVLKYGENAVDGLTMSAVRKLREKNNEFTGSRGTGTVKFINKDKGLLCITPGDDSSDIMITNIRSDVKINDGDQVEYILNGDGDISVFDGINKQQDGYQQIIASLEVENNGKWTIEKETTKSGLRKIYIRPLWMKSSHLKNPIAMAIKKDGKVNIRIDPREHYTDFYYNHIDADWQNIVDYSKGMDAILEGKTPDEAFNSHGFKKIKH